MKLRTAGLSGAGTLRPPGTDHRLAAETRAHGALAGKAATGALQLSCPHTGGGWGHLPGPFPRGHQAGPGCGAASPLPGNSSSAVSPSLWKWPLDREVPAGLVNTEQGILRLGRMKNRVSRPPLPLWPGCGFPILLEGWRGMDPQGDPSSSAGASPGLGSKARGSLQLSLVLALAGPPSC